MIEICELVHRYDGEAVLRGIGLTVADGEFLVLAGPNGSGKTTLVRHCNGLLEPDEGDVLVDGTPVGDDLVAARIAVGLVFQDPRDAFVAATVAEDVAFGPRNLGLPRDEIDRRVDAALAAVKMGDRRDARIDALSGGEQARIAVAGALAMEPDHLVLDEPLAGLDADSRRAVLDRLRDLHADGVSVVVVTHDLRDLLDPADRVVVLRDGQVAANGDPDAVRPKLADLGVRPP